ncbi:hypothetical protein Q9189_002117 [Teloschistes chrysophthalmus]
MYRMSIMTLLCPSPLRERLDIQRAMLLALVHDMAEAVVGDITPADGVEKEEKSRRERETMEYMTSRLLPLRPASNSADDDPGKMIKEAWEEYEADETPEARFVHDVDKLELVIQALEYERDAKGKVDLGEFMGAAGKIRGREVEGWCEGVLEERREFWRGVVEEGGEGIVEPTGLWAVVGVGKVEGKGKGEMGKGNET